MDNTEPESTRSRAAAGPGAAFAIWAVVLVGLTVFFNMVMNRMHNPNQTVHTNTLAGGVREVVLKRNHSGHYVATGKIDNRRVVFLLDTGATDVSVPAAVARALSLPRGPALTYRTANGNVTGYRTRLRRVVLGDIVLRDIAASINPADPGDEVLLGMSFLRKLEFTQRGDTLTLRQYP
jgi:aspartyl protease family protein